MSDNIDIYAAAKREVEAEFSARLNGRKTLTFKEASDLRDYAKSRTNLSATRPTPDQIIWKTVYDSLTEELRRTAPGPMAEIEELDKKKEMLQELQELMVKKINSHPRDYGIRASLAFVICGFLVGWATSTSWVLFITYAAIFAAAGLLFCVFVLDSVELQSKLAIFLYHDLHMRRIAHWLYARALTIR